jgi:hypothetical protein
MALCKQTGQRNNKSNFRTEQFGMMHNGLSCARKSAIFGEAITVAIPIGPGTTVKTGLSAAEM